MMKLLRNTLVIVMTFGLMASSLAKTETQVDESLRVACENTYKSFVFNVMLEKELCHYNGGVAKRLVSLYDKMECDNLLTTEQSKDELAEIVIEDMLKRYHAYGEEVFCETNMKEYVNVKLLLDDAE